MCSFLVRDDGGQDAFQEPLFVPGLRRVCTRAGRAGSDARYDQVQ
jgi:hypothetical protein